MSHSLSKCPLIEIIHIHDCLRGELATLTKDVNGLLSNALSIQANSNMEITSSSGESSECSFSPTPYPPTTPFSSLSKKISQLIARFKIIQSVFLSHSSAEDEFIWPALKAKVNELNSRASDSTSNSSSVKKLHEMVKQEEYEDDHSKEREIMDQLNDQLFTLKVLVDSPGNLPSTIISKIENLKTHR